MANIVINIALGRSAEFYNRVDSNDPAASALIIDILATAGVEADGTLRDKTTFADLVSGTTNFVTQASVRKTLTDTELVAFAADQANDRVDLDFPDQTWTAVAAGDGWNDLVVGYDNDTAAGSDANIVPMTLHDFVVVPDGSDITAQVPNGFFRATSAA